MKRFTVNRRQVLRGAGGVSLGLPLLPSLFPRRADGAEPMLNGEKFFVAGATQHGAIKPPSMYPADAALTQSLAIHPGHNAKSGPLVSRAEGSDRVLSEVLRGPSSKFTDRLIGKMNIMRGFDIPYYIGHHTGGHLGNFVRSDQGPQNLTPFATIDQIMAWSPKFYKSTSGVKQRSIVTGQGGRMSYGYSIPATQSGTVQSMSSEYNAGVLFDKLIAGVSSQPTTPTMPKAPPRKPIVDRILENYRNLRNSNRRLSKDDKTRLDAHVARLAELQRVINDNGSAAVSASCGEFKKPTGTSFPENINLDDPTNANRYYGLLNEVIAMAFACGTSRVATFMIESHFLVPATSAGDWHQDVAHQAEAPDKQLLLVAGARNTFQGWILDMASRLDSIEIAPGVTILDQSLVQWSQESGWTTHDAQDMPIVTFGKAGGYLKTGQFVDFRNLATKSHLDGTPKHFTGLWVRQWLATALQAMGIPPADFERNGKTGYGDAHWDNKYDQAVHPDVINRASDPVPIVTA